MDEVGTRDVRRRVLTGAQTEEGESPGTRYALVIGIDRYREPLRPLIYAVKDAIALAARLEDEFGFVVTRLTDKEATAQAIRDVLGRWEAGTTPDDSVLVFFAGHGSNHPDPARQKEGYLLPGDAGDDPASWLEEAEIIQRAKKMSARRVLLIFDACYAGTTFRHDIPTGARDDQVLKALVAGTEDQPVLDGGAGSHSIFTRSLLDGLDGWAESGQRPDDVITADELIAYVGAEVRWRSRLRGYQQTPVGGPLQGTRTAQDFELRPVRPRLPAPLLRNIYSANPEDRVAAATQLGERGKSGTGEIVQKKAAELVRLVTEDKVMAVRVTAATALGNLGYVGGAEPLATLLKNQKADGRLRAAAAAALGNLAQIAMDLNLADAATVRREAAQGLVEALDSPEAPIVEAAKLGLGHIRDVGPELIAVLQTAGPSLKRDIVDALACLTLNYSGDEKAWLLPGAVKYRLLHRFYLARRRLRPQWPAIRQQALAVGVGGAVGLSVAYLVLIFGIRPFNPTGLAVLSFNLLPGAVGGVGLVFMPRLVLALSKQPDRRATVLGDITSGIVLGLGLGLPNWYLGIGCKAGVCDLLAVFLPGLLLGLLFAFAFAFFSHRMSLAEALGRSAVPLVALALLGGASSALVRVPPSFSWRAIDPQWAELVRWGIGGAIFAVAVATGWRASPGQERPGKPDTAGQR
ncbi:MAG: caspase family protein [Anaerolineae bacterium]|nr:caspase family protein [Anaerolineae bacterium]